MDPIADMFTTIRNAMSVKRMAVTVPYSASKKRILDVCAEQGLIQHLVADATRRTIDFSVVTKDEAPLFSTIRRLSTPGRRLYVRSKDIPRPSGNGLILVSTPQGIMTGRDAKNRHLGGELICEIY